MPLLDGKRPIQLISYVVPAISIKRPAPSGNIFFVDAQSNLVKATIIEKPETSVADILRPRFTNTQLLHMFDFISARHIGD